MPLSSVVFLVLVGVRGYHAIGGFIRIISQLAKGAKIVDLDTKSILLVGQNLFFLGKVDALAEPLGHEVQRAATESDFKEKAQDHRLALVLIDLEGDESIWVPVLEDIKNNRMGVKTVAFGPHENVAVLQQARDLGCSMVLNKGEFNRDLPRIIQEIRNG